MRRAAFIVLGVVALAALVAGCGGGGDKSFDEQGIGITFKYPSKFKETTNVKFGQSAGAPAAARAAVMLNPNNIITVSRYDLNVAITKDNLTKYKGEVDNVIGQLAGKPVSGRQVEYGGLPGYEYAIQLQKPANGLSRLAVLFDQATEYLINCQSAPAKRDMVEDACRKALDTLATK